MYVCMYRNESYNISVYVHIEMGCHNFWTNQPDYN